MTTPKVKAQEKDETVIEEENGVFQRTTEQISLTNRRKYEEHKTQSVETSKKIQRVSQENSHFKTINEQNFLSVPFWKQLDRDRRFCRFRTNEIGSFSLHNRTDEKQCFEDKRFLRVYKYPIQSLNVNFDLKIGENEFISEVQSKNIDPMLWWTLKHKEQIFKNDQFQFDFLSWRGVLRLIMFSIFEKHSDWLLAVIKFKNAYFLCEYTTDMQLKDEQNMSAEHRSFCYYGHKFEEYVTKNETATETLNPTKQFAGVFQSTIDSHRLLYGAEMDCVKENSSEHIELKVCAGNSLNDLPFEHNRKFAKWWIQCFLVGIQTMIIGLRDNNGIVNKIQPLSISFMEQTTRTWSGQSFLKFFLMFVQFLKEEVTHQYSLDHKDVVLFYFNPSSQKITVENSSDPKYQFLPDWFYNGFK